MKALFVKKKTIYSKDISQTRLAKELGYRVDQINNILNGRRHTPHIQEAIAHYFGQPVEEVFGAWAWTKILKQKGRRLRINETIGKKKDGRIRGKNGIPKG